MGSMPGRLPHASLRRRRGELPRVIGQAAERDSEFGRSALRPSAQRLGDIAKMIVGLTSFGRTGQACWRRNVCLLRYRRGAAIEHALVDAGSRRLSAFGGNIFWAGNCDYRKIDGDP